ncbi:MAG TPA: Ldh family oxidoreductase [Chloroflexota bacterium]|nr:Ldh family oxidoreductase [Chloroflexota bacterium]
MPNVSVADLTARATSLLRSAGAPDDIAAATAAAIVGADVVGHESHGVAQLPGYLTAVREGRIVPDARPTVMRETETTALLDAQKGFGHYSATVAIDAAIERARAHHLGAISLANANHIGRLGHYVERAAAAGCIGLVSLGAGGTSGTTAPFGGTRGALGSNPIAAAVPVAGDVPFVMDMATSVFSNGKLGVFRKQGRQLPPGAVLNKDGRPTTDPAAGGPNLPAGGYKGYALSLLNLFTAALAMAGAPAGERIAGTFYLALDVTAFQPLAEYAQRTAAYVEQLKQVPTQEGFDEILLPGERADRTAAERRARGIPVPDDVWAALTKES